MVKKTLKRRTRTKKRRNRRSFKGRGLVMSRTRDSDIPNEESPQQRIHHLQGLIRILEIQISIDNSAPEPLPPRQRAGLERQLIESRRQLDDLITFMSDQEGPNSFGQNAPAAGGSRKRKNKK